MIEDLNQGRWNEKRDRTFNEAVAKWVDQHLPNLKKQSQRRYGTSLRNLIEAFDGVQLRNITSATLSDFEAKRRKQGVTAGTIRRDLSCLSSMMTSCQDWLWVDENEPLRYMRRQKRLGKLRESPPRTRYLAPWEEEVLLDACTDSMYRAIAFAIDTGCRKEEQFSLLKSDVDLVRGVINIRKEITKSTLPREIQITDRTRGIIEYLLTIPGPYLWTRPGTGNRYSEKTNSFWRRLQVLADRCGLAKMTWHDLRRTCGCRLLNEAGWKMHEVSAFLGHSSVSVTEKRYAFLEKERLNSKALPQKGPQRKLPKAANN